MKTSGRIDDLGEVIATKVTESVCILFRTPPIWFSEAGPTSDSWPNYIVASGGQSLLDVVDDSEIANNVRLLSCRGGIFLFDFFGHPELGQSYQVQKAHEDIFRRAGLKIHTNHRSERDPDISGRLKVLNAFQVLLQSSRNPVPFSASFENVGHGFDLKSVVLPLSKKISPFYERIAEGAPKFEKDTTIAAGHFFRSELDQAKKQIGSLLEKKEFETIARLDEMAYYFECQIRRKSGYALTAGWKVIEKFIDDIWLEYISGAKITGARKDRLLSPDYKVSVRIEVLVAIGALREAIYEYIDRIRRARNKWIHEGREPDTSSSQSIYFLIGQVLSFFFEARHKIKLCTWGQPLTNIEHRDIALVTSLRDLSYLHQKVVTPFSQT